MLSHSIKTPVSLANRRYRFRNIIYITNIQNKHKGMKYWTVGNLASDSVGVQI